MRKALSVISALLVMLGVSTVSVAGNPSVKMETSEGDVIIELYPDKAPITVENFLRYVNDGAYDGTIFHRVIPGFMNQGGGFTPEFEKRPTKYPAIKNEADNGLKNTRGTIAMARTPIPDSATNQFFINTADNDALNFRSKTMQGWGYAVFGKVTEGMDVMDRIAATRTGARGPFASDVPEQTIVIERISVLDDAPAEKP
ncbi:MAG: peptidylprolyl isomerase [Gammaproteobacteria bacterium]|jgi:cyclophilin family peptidyl-prolyl cis-trans isomerase